ncbi:hypothetical protein PIGHUM_03601 [Pigmentiphaga humi]|uniref:Uncharacterized protein n=1 Tax=Pigmentiphaga humi TaxID=2478468 RepID=A0A3P4B7M5_9BURK|nr:hypothetical protein PIGHUM_03601 [Pigmentiphaga humi]
MDMRDVAHCVSNDHISLTLFPNEVLVLLCND